jgi:hypothetical protein
MLKGTVARDFLPPIFFIKKAPLGPLSVTFISYEFGLKFIELFEFEFDFPLHNAAGSQILPLHDAAESHDSPLHAVVNHDSPLHDAAVNHDSPLHDAAESRLTAA